MRLKTGEITNFMRAAKPPASGVLIYGPDEGLVRERGEALCKKIVADLNDPFQVTSLSDADVKADPAALANAVGSLSLMGGDRLVRLRPGTDASSESVKAALADLRPADLTDVWLIIEAGDLKPSSSLRKQFEASKTHVALPCYADDARGLEDLIRQTAKAHGLAVAPEAIALLGERLGADRALTRNELEKLCLYVGEGEITEDDVRASVVGDGEQTFDGLVDAVAAGDMKRADREFAKALTGGLPPVGILRMLTNKMKTLHMLAGLTAETGNAQEAVRALRPPVRFPRDKILIRQANLWSRASCERALQLLEAAETECKTSGLPDEAICGRLILSLTRTASASRRR